MTLQIQILIILFSLSVCFSCNEKKNVEQLKEEVIENEESFMQLVDDFELSLPDSKYFVTFGIGINSSVNLTYYKNDGQTVGNQHHYGGQNLKLHSPELDDAIKNLGWTYQTIDKLTSGLKAIHYDYIRNTEFFGKPIEIYNAPNGFVNTDYHIYPKEILDAIKAVHGEPIGQTDFLKRVYIFTSSAL